MNYNIISSILDREHIDELILRSKTKKSHLGTKYKNVAIYGLPLNGVCLKVGRHYVIQKHIWQKYPPTQDQIIDVVDEFLTDTGNNGDIANFDVRHYPYLIEYFVNRGLKYKTLEIISKPNGDQCVCLILSRQTQKLISETGILETRLTGKKDDIEKIIDYLSRYKNNNTKYLLDNEKAEYVFSTMYWKYNKSNVYKAHYELFEMIAKELFQLSITEFMKYRNMNDDEMSKLVEIIKPNVMENSETIYKFLQYDKWQSILSFYCHGKFPLLD